MNPALSNIFGAARAARRAALDEPAAKRVLAAYGLAVPRGITVRPGALPALDGLAGPFAAKLISPDASHKSDVGGVRLGLADASAATAAVREMEALAHERGLALDGVLIEQMAPVGVELVIGGLIDARFGPVVMLGLGGVFVEIFGDTAFRVCPIDRLDALGMIDDLRGAALLRGARGRPPVDEIADRRGAARRRRGAGPSGRERGRDRGARHQSADRLGGRRGRLRRAHRAVEDGKPGGTGAGPMSAYETFGPIFRPRVVAVVGASASGGVSPGNEFIRHCLAFGFDGRLVPIHPSAATVEGLAAAKSFAEVGETIDFAYVAVGAPQVPALIASAAGKVRFAQVMSSGFGEVAAGRALERQLVEAARAAGVRLLGPNCLGVYSPRGKMAFIGGASAEPGAGRA